MLRVSLVIDKIKCLSLSSNVEIHHVLWSANEVGRLVGRGGLHNGNDRGFSSLLVLGFCLVVVVYVAMLLHINPHHPPPLGSVAVQ